MQDFPAIPDFLLVPRDYKPARPTKRLRWTREMVFTTKKKDEDPGTRRLRIEIAKAEAAKKAERIAKLRTYGRG